MEETGRKAVQNGRRSNSKNDHGFCTLFVTFQRKNSLLLLLTSNLSFSYSFKLHNKICLLAFRSPLRWNELFCSREIANQQFGRKRCLFWWRVAMFCENFSRRRKLRFWLLSNSYNNFLAFIMASVPMFATYRPKVEHRILFVKIVNTV